MTDAPKTVPAFLAAAHGRLGSIPIQADRKGEVTLTEMLARAAAAAEGLRKRGVLPGDRVGLLADNSRDWIVADLAIQLTRAISVPRGTDTPVEEVSDLFVHAEVGTVLVHDGRRAKALETIRDRVPTLGEVISIDAKEAPGATLDDLVREGEGGADFGTQAASVQPDDVATIIYTSGTTGRPKGVVLTQSNFGHQTETLPPLFTMGPKERFLSILPPWHSFERTVEYAALASGAGIAYTDTRRLREDLRRYQPTFLPSVPRLWEMIYDGVRKRVDEGSALKRGVFNAAFAVSSARAKAWDRCRGHLRRVHEPRGLGWIPEVVVRAGAFLVAAVLYPLDRLAQRVVFKPVKAATGGRLRGAISGGGLMPLHLDWFFRTIGVPILVGYGLTETSPVVACRRERRNVLGTIGTAIPQVEIEVRDLETGRRLVPGEVGLIHTRGPHVMQGYYNDPSLTRTVIDADGWFDTGDLGYLTDAGDVCFHGRAKETIVLAGGENVEPTRVETAILTSKLVSQVVVVGQDRKTLSALVVVDPDAVASALGLPESPSLDALAERDDVKDLVRKDVIRRTRGLAPFERVSRVVVLPQGFDASNGTLTQTLKLKRHVIVDRYKDRIDALYS